MIGVVKVAVSLYPILDQETCVARDLAENSKSMHVVPIDCLLEPNGGSSSQG